MEVYWYWLCTTGRGHFFYLGKVEDSATAEISRSQVSSLKAHTLQYNIIFYSKKLHLSGVAVDSAPSETGGQWDGSDPSCCQQFGWRSGGRSESSHTLPNEQVENTVQICQHLLECALEQDIVIRKWSGIHTTKDHVLQWFYHAYRMFLQTVWRNHCSVV